MTATDNDESPRLGETPVRMARADLGAVFARPGTGSVPPARSAGLRGLTLREPASVPVTLEPVEPSRAQRDGGPDNADAPAAVVMSEIVVAPITVYLPVSLRDRLRRHRQFVGHTLTTVVLDAVEAVHAELDELLAAHRPTPAGTLFRHRAAPRATATAEPNVQVGLRPSSADLAVLDGLVSTYGAPNRSVLVAVALDRYLPGARPS